MLAVGRDFGPCASWRESAASRPAPATAAAPGPDSGSESRGAAAGLDAVFEAAELEDDPGLEDEQVEELVGAGLASPASCRRAPPWSEIARKAPDIWFVHFEAAPIVCAGLGDEEERDDDVDQREGRARRRSPRSGAGPAPSTSPRSRRPRPRGPARARRRRWRRSSGSRAETGASAPAPPVALEPLTRSSRRRSRRG